jgi:hypothetical protein
MGHRDGGDRWTGERKAVEDNQARALEPAAQNHGEFSGPSDSEGDQIENNDPAHVARKRISLGIIPGLFEVARSTSDCADEHEDRTDHHPEFRSEDEAGRGRIDQS